MKFQNKKFTAIAITTFLILLSATNSFAEDGEREPATLNEISEPLNLWPSIAEIRSYCERKFSEKTEKKRFDSCVWQTNDTQQSTDVSSL